MTSVAPLPLYPKNLTPLNGTLLAWHRTADVQAVRLSGGEEVLAIDGTRCASEFPVQTVIELCGLKPRALKAALLKIWVA